MQLAFAEEPQIEDLIEDSLSEEGGQEREAVRYSISSYGADYTVDGLVKRMRAGSVYVPEFQRGFVWDIRDASRFIESLILGLPVPGIFLSKESSSGKLLVVDGQQRLLSLRYFYDGIWPQPKKEFALTGVDPALAGRTYDQLRADDRLRLDDAILHVTIIKQDEPSDDEGGVYQVFERLNSGGRKLMPQEIRAAVHHAGQMIEILRELNQNPEWRSIYGKEDARMRDQELILRALALYYGSGEYRSPLLSFLNEFMGKNKVVARDRAEAMRKVFVTSIRLVHGAIGKTAFRLERRLNAAVFDSVFVGIARRLEGGDVRDLDRLKTAYDSLLGMKAYQDACGRATAREQQVTDRIAMATSAFAAVP